MKIRITGKGLAKAQIYNSQIGKPMSFPSFGDYAKQAFSNDCPDGYQKNPFTGQCELKPTFGTTSSPQIQTNLGDGFIRNPETGMYGKPAQPQYGPDLYKGTPSSTKQRGYKDLTFLFDVGVGMLGAASGFYDRYVGANSRNKNINRVAHEQNLPDNQLIAPGDYRGMWTTNQGRQDPSRQFSPNLGMTTNTFYPTVSYGKDGLEVPGHVDDMYLPSVYPTMTVPDYPRASIQTPTDIDAVINSDRPPVGSFAPVFPPVSTTALKKPIVSETTSSELTKNIKNIIANEESGGDYKALPKKKDGTLASSAVGKYQFLWNSHKDWITQITGVSSKEEFRNNPEAQEKAFDYWDKTVLTPNAVKIKQEFGVNIPIEKIKYIIHFAGPTGAYNYFKTGKDTKDKFGTSIEKIMQMKFDDGGETTNTNNMKIRITGVPKNLESMAYGGQLGYGFDLGQRNTYSEMKHNPYEKTNKTLNPVSREQANIEAEKGETAYGDIDGDGQKEHMKIGGERHTNGGTPLSVPEGTFIFSDTKKMKIKDPEVLKFFGLGAQKGGYTPAEIAKRYDVNKYKAMLQDPYADIIKKETAKRMIDTYEKKLGYLALIQESMKGFPQGIPEVAENIMGGGMPQQQSQQPTENQQLAEPNEGQFEEQAQEQGQEEDMAEQSMMRLGGSLTKYQDVGEVKEKQFRVGDRDINATYFPYGQEPPAGYVPYPGVTNLYEKPGQDAVLGTDDIGPARGGVRGDEEAYWKNFLIPKLQAGITPEQLIQNKYMHPSKIARARQYYKPIVGKPAVPAAYAYTEEPVVDTPTEQTTKKETPKETSEAPRSEVPSVPRINTVGNKIPFNYDIRDRLSEGNALLNYAELKKDTFQYAPINPFFPRTAMEDWLSKAQEKQQTYKIAADTVAQMMPGQAGPSNLSFFAGNTGAGVSQDITNTNLANIQKFIDYEKQKADILNNAALYNASVKDRNRELLFNINRQFGTEKRLAKNALLQADLNKRTNAINLYNLNQTESPYFTYNPVTGLMEFNSEAARAAFENMKRRGYTGTTDYAALQAKQAVDVYNQVYKSTQGTSAEKAQTARAAMEKILGGKGQATTAVSQKFGGQSNVGYSYNNPFLI